MKKMIATIFLILILMMRLTAPATIFHPLHFMCCISDAKSVYIYNVQDSFLRAVISFESDFHPDVVNPYSKARGVLQILPVMIKEANKIERKLYPQNQTLEPAYEWQDAFNPYISIEIWKLKQYYSNPDYFPDKSIRIWFGTGKQYDGMTWEDYYNEVTKKL